MNSENFGHTAKNKIFRLVKILADLSTRLKPITPKLLNSILVLIGFKNLVCRGHKTFSVMQF